MKRIVFCNDSPGFGGSEMSFIKVLNFLKDVPNVKVIINPDANHQLIKALEENHINTGYYFSPAGIAAFIKGFFAGIKVIKKNSHSIFVLWNHHVDSNRWLQLALGIMNKEYIVVERSVPHSRDMFRNSRLTIPLKKFAVKKASAIILNSTAGLIPYSSIFNIPKQRITIINNGVDVEGINDTVIKLRQQRKEGVNILCLGRLTPEKNFEVVIEAFIQLPEDIRRSLNLIFVGEDGGELARLSALKEKINAENIIFAGYHKNVEQWLAIADMFILPSLYEGLSRALLEAMSCSIPVIVSDIPSSAALIKHMETGLVFKSGSTTELKNCIEYYVLRSDDARQMALNARQLVAEEYNIHSEKQEWLSLFSKYA